MMIEVQSHGFQFEQWVKDTFFGGYEGGYTQEWDIPAEYNNDGGVPSDLHGLPVSVKTAKYGSPVGLGDAVRQRGVNSPFVMIVGFWEQRESRQKWIVDIGVVKFTAKNWGRLWNNLNIKHLQEIDSRIKDRNLHYLCARRLAQMWKKKMLGSYNSEIVINPKIDSKTQRRIQCSLPFKTFWRKAGRDAHKTNSPELFGQTCPNPVISSARTLIRD